MLIIWYCSIELQHSIDSDFNPFYSNVFLKKQFRFIFLWCDRHCELLICPDSLRYRRPLYRYPDRIRGKKTYEVYLFIPIVFYNFKNNDLFARWLKLGHIPLLTRQGHFLSDGVCYVWVTQIVRKPGVYLFNKSKSKKD